MGKSIVKARTAQQQQKGVEILRNIGSLREGELRDAAYARAWQATGGHFPPLVLPENGKLDFIDEERPALARMREYGCEPRCEGRNAATLIRYMTKMRRQLGQLVALRISCPEADGYSIIMSEGRKQIVLQAKKVVYAFMGVYAKRATMMAAVIERDEGGSTHIHLVIALEQLSRTLQAILLDAPRGEGGGTMLSPEIHGVIIGDSAEDVQYVAMYMCKYPDARAYLDADDPLHQDLLEEIAVRAVFFPDDPRVKLSWYLPKGWQPGMKSVQ